MQQQSLLNDSPIARTADPISSHIAAEMITDKKRATQQRKVLELVQNYPGHTSKELAELANDNDLDYHTIARRLPELRGNKDDPTEVVRSHNALGLTILTGLYVIQEIQPSGCRWYPTGRQA